MPEDYISDLPRDLKFEVFDLLSAEALNKMLQTAKPIARNIENYFTDKAEVIELKSGKVIKGKASEIVKGIGQGRYARSADSAEIVRSMTKSLMKFVDYETDPSGNINWEKAAERQAGLVADMAKESPTTDGDALRRRSALETFTRSALADGRLVTTEWYEAYTGSVTEAIDAFAKGAVYYR